MDVMNIKSVLLFLSQRTFILIFDKTWCQWTFGRNSIWKQCVTKSH